MSMTMTQKILADHAGLNEVVAGQLIEEMCIRDRVNILLRKHKN